jgi:4-oxalocrotonate tautomerase
MPIIQAFLLEGRSEEKKAAFIAAVTDAAIESLGAPRESIRVIITEMPATDYGIAGLSVKQRQSAAAAEQAGSA